MTWDVMNMAANSLRTHGGCLQDACTNWSFDMLTLNIEADQHALSCLGFFLFQVRQSPCLLTVSG